MICYKKGIKFSIFLSVFLSIFFISSFFSEVLSDEKEMKGNKKLVHYEIDPVHTFILFKIKHQGFSHSYGRFTDTSGEILLDEKNPKNTKIHLKIKTASLDTQHVQRDKHLKGVDFFNVKKYPSISFKSEKVQLKKKNHYLIQGVLEFRGKKKPLRIDFKRLRTGRDHRGQLRTGGDTSFTLKRSEFGMTYMLDDETGIPDQVEIIVSIEAIKKS